MLTNEQKLLTKERRRTNEVNLKRQKNHNLSAKYHPSGLIRVSKNFIQFVKIYEKFAYNSFESANNGKMKKKSK